MGTLNAVCEVFAGEDHRLKYFVDIDLIEAKADPYRGGLSFK